MKQYRVEYSAHAWQPRSRHQLLPHQPVEECQVVERDLTDDERLHVELARAPGGSPRVIVARVTSSSHRTRRKPFCRTTRFLSVDQLELVEVP